VWVLVVVLVRMFVLISLDEGRNLLSFVEKESSRDLMTQREKW